VSAGEERVVFMTTNHITKLDPALVRPGRVDVMHAVGNADESQVRRMFLKFYPGETEASENFATALKGVDVSMALLQGFFLQHRDDGAPGALRATQMLREEAEAIAELQKMMFERHEQGNNPAIPRK
jgi:chaperone BCS1